MSTRMIKIPHVNIQKIVPSWLSYKIEIFQQPKNSSMAEDDLVVVLQPIGNAHLTIGSLLANLELPRSIQPIRTIGMSLRSILLQIKTRQYLAMVINACSLPDQFLHLVGIRVDRVHCTEFFILTLLHAFPLEFQVFAVTSKNLVIGHFCDFLVTSNNLVSDFKDGQESSEPKSKLRVQKQLDRPVHDQLL